MIITIKQLHHDTYHFFRKQIGAIFLISIAVTLISIAINMIIQPDMHIMSIIDRKKFFHSHSLLDFINNMNAREKYDLLKYSILKIIEILISKTLLLGSIIILISNLASNQKQSITLILYSLSKFLPSLFTLNCLTAFISQVSFMFFVIPGIFLSILLSLSPIILFFTNNGTAHAIRHSICIAWKYIMVIGPSILLWMSGKFFLTIIISHIYFINKNVIFLLLNVSSNVLYSILIIYLFRFYMLFLRC